MLKPFWLFLFLFLGIFGAPLDAAPQPFQSQAKQTTLIELFSSEGCSSCPPAEEWLRGLQSKPGLWQDFIPVGFHVDYWNRLGWVDRFSSPEYTNRQDDYIQAWHENTLYTPGYVVNGKAWDGWRYNFEPLGSSENPGILKVENPKEFQFMLSFKPTEPLTNLEAHLALLGFGLESKVTSGENSGKLLKHDFVVLDYRHSSLNERNAASFAMEPKVEAPRYGVAAWISRRDDPAPVQAAGGYLTD